jgi:hypothetical protein
VARHLTEYGSARNTVKLGIVVLGECGNESDRGLLLLLGAVEEFTLYAVVALIKTQPDRERAAYELARRVKGWGWIHAVERLEDTDDPEIKAWLLREGFRNDIMDEYLAHLAATTGDLYTALLDPDVDGALLEGAGGILAALALGGHAKDMFGVAVLGGNGVVVVRHSPAPPSQRWPCWTTCSRSNGVRWDRNETPGPRASPNV